LLELGAQLIASSSLVVAVVLFVMQVLSGAHSVGQLTFAVATTNTLANALASFTRNIGAHSADAITVRKLRELLEYPRFLLENGTGRLDCVSTGATPTIEFRNVGFSWDPNRPPAIRDLSFHINPGEKVGLVGLNGSGKSTTLLLLGRLIYPTSGSIHLDGTSLADIDETDLRRTLNFLPQTHWHQPFSIAQNIALGAKHQSFDMPRVRLASDFAAATEFIQEKPKGFGYTPGTWAGDGELSGGENQKVGIARVVYQEAPIMVLDEPTTAIDAPSRTHIYRNLAALSAKTTLLIVTHELDVLKSFCNRIIVLEHGSVIEDGPFEALANKPGGRFSEFLANRELLDATRPQAT
jgi:ABC-type multidrug transport system fused ATPase/permease subunit